MIDYAGKKNGEEQFLPLLKNIIDINEVNITKQSQLNQTCYQNQPKTVLAFLRKSQNRQSGKIQRQSNGVKKIQPLQKQLLSKQKQSQKPQKCKNKRLFERTDISFYYKEKQNCKINRYKKNQLTFPKLVKEIIKKRQDPESECRIDLVQMGIFSKRKQIELFYRRIQSILWKEFTGGLNLDSNQEMIKLESVLLREIHNELK